MKKPARPLTEQHFVDICATEQFIMFQSLSGYGLIRPEDGSTTMFLATDAGSAELGAMLLKALKDSRFIPPGHPEFGDFSDMEKYTSHYASVEDRILRRARRRSAREAYRNSVYCSARLSQDTLEIRPYAPYKGSGQWGALPDEMTVTLPASDDPDVVGAALRKAFENGGWEPRTLSK